MIDQTIVAVPIASFIGGFIGSALSRRAFRQEKQRYKNTVMAKVFQALMRVRLSDKQKDEFLTELRELGVLPPDNITTNKTFSDW